MVPIDSATIGAEPSKLEVPVDELTDSSSSLKLNDDFFGRNKGKSVLTIYLPVLLNFKVS